MLGRKGEIKREWESKLGEENGLVLRGLKKTRRMGLVSITLFLLVSFFFGNSYIFLLTNKLFTALKLKGNNTKSLYF